MSAVGKGRAETFDGDVGSRAVREVCGFGRDQVLGWPVSISLNSPLRGRGGIGGDKPIALVYKSIASPYRPHLNDSLPCSFSFSASAAICTGSGSGSGSGSGVDSLFSPSPSGSSSASGGDSVGGVEEPVCESASIASSTGVLEESSKDMVSSVSTSGYTHRGTRGLLTRRSCPARSSCQNRMSL